MDEGYKDVYDPFITVLTPVYATDDNGRLDMLKTCIDSVKHQKTPYEHIILDDGSPIDIYYELNLVSERHIRYYRFRHMYDLDPTYLYRTGVHLARGDFCILLGSDDWFIEDSLLNLERCIRPGVVAVAGGAYNHDDDGNVEVFQPLGGDIRKRTLTSNPFHCCATMFSTQMARDVDPFPTYAYHAGDWDLWMKLSEAGDIAVTPEPIVNYYQHNGTFKNNLDKDRRDRAMSDIQLMAMRRRGIPTE